MTADHSAFPDDFAHKKEARSVAVLGFWASGTCVGSFRTIPIVWILGNIPLVKILKGGFEALQNLEPKTQVSTWYESACAEVLAVKGVNMLLCLKLSTAFVCTR